MKYSINTLLTRLKQAGFKQTQPRQAVTEWITKHDGVFSANEIIKAIPQLDRVSIYRILECLTKLDAIHSVFRLHGEEHYEKHETNHHHHAVCEGCEKTTCIPCTIRQKKISGFRQIHHSFVFTGLCVKCG